MRSEQLQIHLRSRSMMEALDLGVRLALQERGGLLRVYLPLAALVGGLALSSLWLAPWAPVLVVLLAKPWLDRALLHFYARRVFGQPCALRDVLSAEVLLSPRLWPGLLLARLSPWRAMVQPIGQLEGLRGAAARQRRRVLLQGQRGMAMLAQVVWAHAEAWLALALTCAFYWADPFSPMRELYSWLLEPGQAGMTWLTLCAVLAALVLEPLSLAGGFMMYLNRRVMLESWDLEQELRHAFAA